MSGEDSSLRLPTCNRSSSAEDLYALLAAIRVFEQSLLEMFDQGLLVGTTHTCLGQEATAVGVVSALDLERDVVFSNHRCHGHFLAYCGEVERLYLEVMGKPGGVCAGRGGSQHIHTGNFYSNGVQGGIVPVTAGIALAEKEKDSGVVATVFLGDGTLGEGVVYESLNLASLWGLPVLFVVENNGYAQSTPFERQAAGSMRARPEAFAVGVEELRSTDAQEIQEAAARLVDLVREESAPRCLLLHNYRLGPHSKGDDDRDRREIEDAWKREPLAVMATHLDETRVKEIGDEAGRLVERARMKAVEARPHEG